ncbi:MAG: hypothetical protein FWG12_07825 [Holophagaceae bacterium]|nr:hypothetical protein [Holophagaceae bacterium]
MVTHKHFSTLLAALLLFAFGTILFSQADFEVAIARHKGNKIVLLGGWEPSDRAKWTQTLSASEIVGHGFTLLQSAHLSFGGRANNSPEEATNRVDTFELWFRQIYALSGIAKWAALDVGNKLIAAGQQAPNPRELGQLLESKGIKTPISQIKDFLRLNPEHLDAMSDMLIETRRWALHGMPNGTSESLSNETDLRIWAAMASETDKVFDSNWLGVRLNFFDADLEQPEQFSKLMKAIFRKHISGVESALRLQPTDTNLWNIWTWMARGMGDYKWDTFIDSIGPFDFRINNSIWFCPPPDTAVWLVADASSKKDWGMVAKLARIARRYSYMVKEFGQAEWTPGVNTAFFDNTITSNPNHPFKTAFIPHIEALLRLGNISEANAVYDEMMRWEFPSDSDAGSKRDISGQKLECAKAAAAVAKATGMAELAIAWERGELINNAPYRSGLEGYTYFYAFTQRGSEFYRNLHATLQKLNPPNGVSMVDPWRDHPTLGWKTEDGDKWALIRGDGLLAAYGSDIPDVETMQHHWDTLNKVGQREAFRNYIVEHSDQPGLALEYSFHVIQRNMINFRNRSNSAPNAVAQADDEYSVALDEAIRLLRRGISDYPGYLACLPATMRENPMTIAVATSWMATSDNSRFKALAAPYLAAIEPLLEKKPSSDPLWGKWFFWRAVEGLERPLEPLIARLRYSPLSTNSMGLPPFALDMYLDDCKRTGRWTKATELLEPIWERELLRAAEVKNGFLNNDQIQGDMRYRQSGLAGDRIGIPLIEAYLNDGRSMEANEVFNTWMDLGYAFRDISKIMELAKAKGQERLALEWETKAKK